ncbi:hypothetical protein ACHAWF_015058 [Thalassiosira exigua]
MQRGRKNQTTLLGLWQGAKGGAQPQREAAGRKRNREPSPLPPPRRRCLPPPPLRLGRLGDPQWENISLPNGPMLLLRGCIGGGKASERRSTRESLASLPHWNVTFKIFGKECKMRRRICQFSTNGKLSYSYSGLNNTAAPEFPEIVNEIKRQVEDAICDYMLGKATDAAGKSKHLSISSAFMDIVKSVKNGSRREIYNYCLLNHYRNGEDYMGYHADDERSLDPMIPIASVSLGVVRSFDIRPVRVDDKGKRTRVERISLGDGDLILMLPPMQSNYQHSVPIEKRVTGERINLTFRRVVTPSNELY